MRVLKRSALFLTWGVLRIGLLAFALLFAFRLVFASPEPLKQSLRDSGLYDIKVSNLVRSAADDRLRIDTNELSPDHPLFLKAAEQALPQDIIQTTTEKVIDGTYVWLVGEAEYPDFNVDLAPEKAAFIRALANNASQRVAELEPCTFAQLQRIREIDPFTIACRPPINLDEQRQQVIADLSSDKDFFPDPQLNGKELLQEAGRHDSVNALQSIPETAQTLFIAPWFILGVMVLAAGLILYWSNDRQKAAQRLARSLIITGVIVALIELVVLYVTRNIEVPAGIENAQLQEALLNVVIDLRWQLSKITLGISAVYIVLGSAVLLYQRNNPPASKSPSTDAPVDKP